MGFVVAVLVELGFDNRYDFKLQEAQKINCIYYMLRPVAPNVKIKISFEIVLEISSHLISSHLISSHPVFVNE